MILCWLMRLRLAKVSGYGVCVCVCVCEWEQTTALKRSYVCIMSVLQHTTVVLMRWVCVSRGDNPVSRLQSPSETTLSHFIHFNLVLGDSLISHNAIDQWFLFSNDAISVFKPVLRSYLTVFWGAGIKYWGIIIISHRGLPEHINIYKKVCVVVVDM